MTSCQTRLTSNLKDMTSCQARLTGNLKKCDFMPDKLTGNLKDVTPGNDRAPADYSRTRIKWHCIEEEN